MNRSGAAHQREHGTAEARADPSPQSGGVGAEHRRALFVDDGRCRFGRDAAVSRARAGGVDDFDAAFGRHDRGAREISVRCRFWRTVRDCGVTWYSAVPTIHSLLLARAGDKRPEGAEGLRFIRSCSAALPPEMMAKMEEVFGAPVLEAYGMTEASHQMASNPQPPSSRKPGSVGPGTGVKIGIMDGGGNLLATGERGEVVIQGPNVVDGYENNPEANAVSFTNGWFRTGDQGFLDSEGYLTLTGRIKELINRGGEKIAPREIDEILLAHPAVAEAVAFGVPHATWGEEVAAAVVLKEAGGAQSESAILAFCKERLADFKCPKKLYIVETIPRTATGKIARGAVAKALAGTA